MEKTLRQFQLEELEMLKRVASRLAENEIPFYLIGGSCIGALRHQGFIPWDDDVDVAILRRDFDKAEKALADLGEEMFYDPIEHHLIADAPIGHVYKNEPPLEEAPRIDVFAIDTIPDSKLMQKYQKLCALVYHVCILRRPAENRGKLRKLLTSFICNCFPAFLLNFLQKISYKGITKWKYCNNEYVSNIFGVCGDREKVPSSFYGEPRYVPFEDTLMPIPERAEDYNYHIYGDYMEYPPEEKRVPAHFKLHNQ